MKQARRLHTFFVLFALSQLLPVSTNGLRASEFTINFRGKAIVVVECQVGKSPAYPMFKWSQDNRRVKSVQNVDKFDDFYMAKHELSRSLLDAIVNSNELTDIKKKHSGSSLSKVFQSKELSAIDDNGESPATGISASEAVALAEELQRGLEEEASSANSLPLFYWEVKVPSFDQWQYCRSQGLQSSELPEWDDKQLRERMRKNSAAFQLYCDLSDLVRDWPKISVLLEELEKLSSEREQAEKGSNKERVAALQASIEKKKSEIKKIETPGQEDIQRDGTSFKQEDVLKVLKRFSSEEKEEIEFSIDSTAPRKFNIGLPLVVFRMGLQIASKNGRIPILSKIPSILKQEKSNFSKTTQSFPEAAKEDHYIKEVTNGVDSLPNGMGFLHMIGNVSEWVVKSNEKGENVFETVGGATYQLPLEWEFLLSGYSKPVSEDFRDPVSGAPYGVRFVFRPRLDGKSSIRIAQMLRSTRELNGMQREEFKSRLETARGQLYRFVPEARVELGPLLTIAINSLTVEDGGTVEEFSNATKMLSMESTSKDESAIWSDLGFVSLK